MQKSILNIVIFGATSRIAECCAREWAAGAAINPVHFVLVARNAAKLEAIASDLRLRLGQSGRVSTIVSDLAEPDAQSGIVEAAFRVADSVDIVLLAYGWLPDQQGAQRDPAQAAAAIAINGMSPVLLAERVAERLEGQGRGTLAVIGSVAGDRGRASNYLYGAAKAMVATHAEGVRLRLWKSGVRVVIVKPGPTATPMTASLAISAHRLASPEAVARDIVKGIEAGTHVIYTPVKWRLFMFIIRNIPYAIFKRLGI